VQKATFAYWSNFAIAEKADRTDGAEAFLDEMGIMVRTTKHSLSTSITAAKAGAIDC